MKRIFFLCTIISAALILGSCENQGTSAANGTSSAARRGFYDPGSVGPVSGGPAGPIKPPQRFQP